MPQITLFCVIVVLALDCSLVSSKNTSFISLVSPSKEIISTSQQIIATSPIKASSTVNKSATVITGTPSLTSFSSGNVISTTNLPVKSSSVPGTAIVSASPTVSPASETIRIPKTGPYCLQAFLDVQFEVRYDHKNKSGAEEKEKATVVLNGDLQNEVNGSCSKKSAWFTVSWKEKNEEGTHNFSMYFRNYTVNGTAWTVTNMKAQFNTKDHYAFKVDADKEMILAESGPGVFGNISHGKTYLCNAKNKIKMGENVTVTFKHLVLQPFSNRTLQKDGYHCPADAKTDDDNTVPIAVGAALGGLVLIVLVAYIVGRRRSNRGYEQV